MKYLVLLIVFIVVGLIVVAVAYATAGFAEVLLIQDYLEEEEKLNENIIGDVSSTTYKESL